MSILEWSATILSLIYLYFAIKNKPICFFFGMLGSGIWAFVSFEVGLKFDAALQLFYVVISIYGLYNWRYGGKEHTELPITKLKLRTHFYLIVIGILISIVLVVLSKNIEFINLPILDATTTVFLVIGTLLLIQRILSSWIYLVIADVFYIYIYGVSGLYLFLGIMVIYILFGLKGYFSWKHLFTANQKISTVDK